MPKQCFRCKNNQKLQVVSASLVSALEKPELATASLPTTAPDENESAERLERLERLASTKLLSVSEEVPKSKPKKPYKKTKKKNKTSYNKTRTTQREPKEGDVIFSYFVPYSTSATTTKVETPAKNSTTNASTSTSTSTSGSIPSQNKTKAPNMPNTSGTSFERAGRDEVFKISEIKPTYPGGEREMNRFLSSAIRYPTKAREEKIEGTVFMQFVIEKDGTVDDISVAKGVHPLLDAEAKRVVSRMPKWAAGRQNGRDVAVQYTLPVRFQLVD